MELRPYQTDILNRIQASWASGARNVLAVLPTGAGKTVIFAKILAEHTGNRLAIAHRQELVGQISIALGRYGALHKILAPRKVVKHIVSLHMDEFGRSWYDPRAPLAVAGVDTLLRGKSKYAEWLKTVSLWVQDEAHHILADNKWGIVAQMSPDAYGLGVTAVPLRADGKGLGRHADGLMDTLIVGISMRECIDRGYLTDYRIFAPRTSDLDLSTVPVSKSTGDFTRPGLVTAVRKSRIVGDIVEHYQRIAEGKLGLTFVTDVKTATDTAAAYVSAGVPAEVVSHKTPDRVRAQILKRFKDRKILQLVNVDLFGEGFDVPAVEVVSFARPTQSLNIHRQQFGRALRILEGKTEAIIIDHVGNVQERGHGLPDSPREWTLDRRNRRSNGVSDAIPTKTCPECTAVYERIHVVCPYCGYVNVPDARATPEQVDGDLYELDPATLAKMRGDIEHVDASPEAYRAYLQAKGCPAIGVVSNIKAHKRQYDSQQRLRQTLALWGALQRQMGRSDQESYRRFYFRFGIDILSAQALGDKDATDLKNLIERGIL